MPSILPALISTVANVDVPPLVLVFTFKVVNVAAAEDAAPIIVPSILPPSIFAVLIVPTPLTFKLSTSAVPLI